MWYPRPVRRMVVKLNPFIMSVESQKAGSVRFIKRLRWWMSRAKHVKWMDVKPNPLTMSVESQKAGSVRSIKHPKWWMSRTRPATTPHVPA